MVTLNIKPNPEFSALFMRYTELLCTASNWLYTSAFPQAPACGQDNASVEISQGERLDGSRGGDSFPALEVLDLYPSAAAG